MKKYLIAALLAAPLLVLTALPVEALAALPSKVVNTDAENDACKDYGAFKACGLASDIEIYKEVIVNRGDDVQFSMKVDDLNKENVSGTRTDENGNEVPIGYFSFMIRVDGEKKPSLLVGRWKGVTGVFPAGDPDPEPIECSEVKGAFSLTKERVRYTVPTDCLGGAKKARVRAIAVEDNENSYEYDDTSYAKDVKIG